MRLYVDTVSVIPKCRLHLDEYKNRKVGECARWANLEWVERKNLVMPNLMQTEGGLPRNTQGPKAANRFECTA